MTTEAKKVKVKGPIRYEAIVPTLVIFGLVWAYFHFFFDNHLRWGIEYGATQANGAEVNVRSLKTNFLKGDFELRGFEITDSEEPNKNALEIGRIHFKFFWDALLRMKFVVDDAAIDQFLVGTIRKKAGYVLPKKQEVAIEQAEAETQGSALADAGKLILGALPDINPDELQNLKSLERVKALQSELENKQKMWQGNVNTLPTEKDLNDLRDRISNLRIGGDVGQIQKQITDAANLVSEVQTKTNDIKTKANALKSDLGKFGEDIGGIQKSVQEDIRHLESKLKLPRIDVESLSKQFFGPQVMGYVKKGQRYVDMAQEYMPPMKSKEEREAERIKARERKKGRNFEFPRTNSYPLFWVKRAALSSTSEGSPFGGDVAGEILDASSNQRLTGKPTVMKLAGDFPVQEIRGVAVMAVFDHRSENPSQQIKAKVRNYGVGNRMLSDTEDVKFGFTKAQGQLDIEGRHQAGVIDLKVKGLFDQIDYLTDAKNAVIKEIIGEATKDLASVSFNAAVGGSFSDLNFNVTSNIGENLQRSFERQFKGKIEEAKRKLQDSIDSKISEQKKMLVGQFSQIENGLKGQLDEKNKEIDKIKGQADSKLADAKKQVQRQVEDQGKKAIDDLKNKFGF